ncbi:hypothetical protein [Mesoterricola silvestris]|uniref:Uncharacterized protein n=1 Tax=Mesoterricola silvestris TaxID=2927979 RepID=A0AA48K8E7_9BACT|nr:hypothetical protein [Mesoterricola silvestris]BDU72050.1 hypothetical protein METEAL_12240 [Mesoterricola silvestris]
MRIAPLPLLLALPLVQCGHGVAERNARALDQIRTLRAELHATNRDAFDRFTNLQDYPEIRRAFGTESLDPGTPLGPHFQESLDQMLDLVLKKLAAEPDDAYFLNKAAKEVRRFGTWWRFQASLIQTRNDRLRDHFEKERDSYSTSGQERFRLGLEVLDEIVNVLREYERRVEACARRIEALDVKRGGW